MGFFATALNLLPLWQLDGGHIVYSLASTAASKNIDRRGAGPLVLGKYAWPGWYGWGGVLLILSLRFGHPPVMDRWEQLDASRKLWAVGALAIFLLCFTPVPAMAQ